MPKDRNEEQECLKCKQLKRAVQFAIDILEPLRDSNVFMKVGVLPKIIKTLKEEIE